MRGSKHPCYAMTIREQQLNNGIAFLQYSGSNLDFKLSMTGKDMMFSQFGIHSVTGDEFFKSAVKNYMEFTIQSRTKSQ